MYVLVILLAACTGRDPSLAPAEPPTGRVLPDGPVLRDDFGRQVVLRGFNAGGRAKMPPYMPFEYEGEPLGPDFQARGDRFFSQLAGLGANTIRLTFAWEALEPTRGTWDDDYLARYRALLDLCEDHGLRAIVDFHQDVYASPFCGDGFPLWTLGDMEVGPPRYDCSSTSWGLAYFDGDGQVAEAFDRLYANEDGIQDDMEAMWRHMAGALDGHPAIAGYETVNEPGWGSGDPQVWDQEVWPVFTARMGAAIQESTAERVAVFAGGRPAVPGSDDEALVEPALDDFVFAPHYYNSAVFLSLPEYDAAAVSEDLEHVFAPGEDWGVPVVLGEFGGPNSAPSKGDYVGHVLDRVDTGAGHAIVWDAAMGEQLWNGEDFTVLDPDGELLDWADDFARAVPRAVAGELDAFTWDREDHTLELVIVPDGEPPSEIFLPVRHLGDDPDIEVDGGRWNWLPDAQLLLLQGRTGEPIEVRVAPG